MVARKMFLLIASQPEMALPLLVKVLINHVSRWAVMGLSSQGNELIYYQAPSVGAHPGFWEKKRLLAPETDILAIWGKPLEMSCCQTSP